MITNSNAVARGWLVLWCLVCPASAGASDYLEYSGTALERRSGRFLYSERHWLKYEAGRLAERVVLYACSNGTAFARKSVGYRDPVAPEFLFEDASNGMREGVRGDSGRRFMFFRANGHAAEQSAEIRAVDGLVADAGFDEFVRLHWEALLGGQSLRFPFLVPSRQRAMNFQLQHVKTELRRGEAGEVFRLRLTGLLAWAWSGVEVTYASGNRALLRYEGLSGLRDAAGDNLQTHILFDPKDRQSSSGERMSAARTAGLSSCP